MMPDHRHAAFAKFLEEVACVRAFAHTGLALNDAHRGIPSEKILDHVLMKCRGWQYIICGNLHLLRQGLDRIPKRPLPDVVERDPAVRGWIIALSHPRSN